MSRVLDARGIAHEIHMDNSIKEVKIKEILQNSISPVFSQKFDKIVFMKAYSVCAQDILQLIYQSLDHPVSIIPLQQEFPNPYFFFFVLFILFFLLYFYLFFIIFIFYYFYLFYY